MAEEEKIDHKRRGLLWAFAAPLAQSILPAPAKLAATLVTPHAGPSALAVYEAIGNITVELGILGLDQHNIINFGQRYSDLEEAGNALGSMYGSREHFIASIEGNPLMPLNQLRLWMQELQALNPSPAQIQAALDVMAERAPDVSFALRDRAFFDGWLGAGSNVNNTALNMEQAIDMVRQEMLTTYDGLWLQCRHLEGFKEGVEDYDFGNEFEQQLKESREASEKPASVFPDRESARKASGHAVAARLGSTTPYPREPVTIGTHYTSSGERYEHLGTVAPAGHIDITKF